jgi:MOSC domain-containing protein YiiM
MPGIGPRLTCTTRLLTVAQAADGILVSVNIAHIRTGKWTGTVGRTGIDKRPVTGRVRVEGDEVVGDAVLDRRHHGGPDQAVYCYSREDAGWWETDLGRTLTDGMFGENFTTTGIDLTAALIGERWDVGTASFEVSCPRIPCRVFAGFWEVPQLIKRFTDRALPGAYLRILRAGEVGAGDSIKVTYRPPHAVTIGETFRALTGNRDLVAHVRTAEQLPLKHHATLAKFASAS